MWLEPLLDQSGGILRVPPDLHGGAFRQGHLKHDLHELVHLFPIGGVGNQAVLNLLTNLFSLLRHFVPSFRRSRWHWGAGGKDRMNI